MRITFIFLLLTSLAVAQQTDAQHSAEADIDIDALIEGLDSDRFAERQASEQALLRLGPAAGEQLRQAIADAEGEVKLRLQRILTEVSRSLRLVDKVTSALLKSVTSVAISRDGKFLYAAAFDRNTISVYAIDSASGKLREVQTLTDNSDLRRCVSFRLSDTSPLGVAACFAGRSVTLLSRDADSGKVSTQDVYRGGGAAPRPKFPIEAAFTPDGRYVFVLDGLLTDGNNLGAIIVLEVTEDQKLRWVQTCFGQQNCFADVRGIVFHPTRHEFYACASRADSLVRASYDPDSGAVEVQQMLRDSRDGVQGLAGAFSVDISADGRFVYTSAGRFRGDHAVGVYRFDADGNLQVVQELIQGRDEIGSFRGGNELVVAPDGLHVYAAGTTSSSLAGFSRDPDSGKLAFIETVPLGDTDAGPAGLAISRDGRYVYAAVEGESAIAVLRRKTD